MTGASLRRVLSRCGLTAAGLLIAAGAPADDITPHQLLDRMNEAVSALDYEGRFVVQGGDHLDAMYLVHRADGGAEKERVVSLTGNPREIIRSDEAVACLVSGRERPINVGRRAHGRSVSPLRGISSEQLNQSYQLHLLEPSRVAGREAYQVLIEPRDDLRFGYRLFIDRQHALPLRSIMYDENQQVVSQMMFVELRINEAITPIEHDLSAMQVARPDEPAGLPVERLAPPAWEFSALPPGFHLNAHRRRVLSDDRGVREHFIFTDGLATVSVYIQPARDGRTMQGASRLGAAKVAGRTVGSHEVIAIGEVPLKTLNLFTSQVRATSP